MFYTIQAPDELNIALQIPASKSISNRALIMQALTKGTTTLHHLSDCDDTLVLQHACPTPSIFTVPAVPCAF